MKLKVKRDGYRGPPLFDLYTEDGQKITNILGLEILVDYSSIGLQEHLVRIRFAMPEEDIEYDAV